jgi:hypothetical protein
MPDFRDLWPKESLVWRRRRGHQGSLTLEGAVSAPTQRKGATRWQSSWICSVRMTC